MSEVGKAVSEAMDIEAEAIGGVEAAQSERERGQHSVSLGLLREAIEKERASLDLLEQGVETLQQSLDERRHALDQQQDILSQLIDDLDQKERSRVVERSAKPSDSHAK